MARLKTLPQAVDLKEARELLRQGNVKGLSRPITIDLMKASDEDVFALLELLSYRRADHRLLKTSQASSLLENARKEIHLGDFGGALDRMDQAEEIAGAGDPELRLEKARARAFQGDYTGTLTELGSADEAPWTGIAQANTTGVACQVRGHALLELGRLAESREQLLEAIRIGELIGNSVGVLAASLFLWKLAAIEKDTADAERWRERAAGIVAEQIQSMRWLLGYYRMRAHSRLLLGQSGALESAVAAIGVAKNLGDTLFVDRGLLELTVMTGLILPGTADLYRAPDKHDSSEYRAWLAAAQGLPVQDPPLTLQLFKKTRKLLSGAVPGLEPAWIYDDDRQSLLDLGTGAIVALARSSTMVRILRTLNETTEALTPGDLFERVWRLTWNPDRHAATVKVSLLRLNKLVSNLTAVRENGKIRLKNKGLLLNP
jgi:hypothetical protein